MAGPACWLLNKDNLNVHVNKGSVPGRDSCSPGVRWPSPAGRARGGLQGRLLCPSAPGKRQLRHSGNWDAGPGGGISAPGNSSVTLKESLGLILLIVDPGRCAYRTPLLLHPSQV